MKTQSAILRQTVKAVVRAGWPAASSLGSDRAGAGAAVPCVGSVGWSPGWSVVQAGCLACRVQAQWDLSAGRFSSFDRSHYNHEGYPADGPDKTRQRAYHPHAL